MFRAIALKELREVRGIAILVFLAAAYLMINRDKASFFPAGSIFYRLPEATIPFVTDGIMQGLTLLAGVATIAIGLRQTLGESIRGTYVFLYHRPVGRGRLIGVKLLVGMAVYLAATGVPLLGYAIWAATPGTHPSPFFWSMTLPAWLTWFSMTILYFGAFLSGVRPGRWFGSRLLPLMAAAAVLLFLSMIEGSPWPQDWMRLCRLAAVAAGDAAMVAIILFVVDTRDY